MNNPTLDTWTIVFFLGAIHGLFLGTSIALNKSRVGKVNRYLGAFILLFSLMLLDYFSYWSNYRYQFPSIFGFSFGFPFWYGPVLYLYIRALNQQSALQWPAMVLHFLPGFLYYVLNYQFYLMPAVEKIELFDLEQTSGGWQLLVAPALHIAHMIVYTVLATRLIRKKVQETGHSPFYRWQHIFVGLFALYIVATLTYYVLIISIDFEIEYDYMISLTMMLAIYTIGYLGYHNPQILHGFHEMKSKYEKSSLRKTDARDLLASVTRLLEQDKIYRRNDLKLQNLADLLEIPSHHLSQLVNEHLHMSFPDLINSYRVEEVKMKLRDPDYAGEKILGIAFDAGFNNKANFNTAFKKFAEVSPSEYRKLHQLEFMN